MSDGVRKLIYLSSQDIWDSIKAEGKEVGRSASNYLINLHREHVVRISEPVRMEGQPIPSNSAAKAAEGTFPEFEESSGALAASTDGDQPDPEKISGSQEIKDISETKDNPVQKAADDLEKLTQGNTTFNPQLKTKDKPKKGK